MSTENSQAAHLKNKQRKKNLCTHLEHELFFWLVAKFFFFFFNPLIPNSAQQIRGLKNALFRLN